MEVYDAALLGDVRLLRERFATGVDINWCDKNGATALHLAAVNGHTDCVTALVETGADLNKQTKIGRAPLHVAAGEGHSAAVVELLKGGANINIKTNAGRTPLYFAVTENKVGVVQILLDHGADPRDMSARKALAIATEKKYTQVVELLQVSATKADQSEGQSPNNMGQLSEFNHQLQSPHNRGTHTPSQQGVFKIAVDNSIRRDALKEQKTASDVTSIQQTPGDRSVKESATEALNRSNTGRAQNDFAEVPNVPGYSEKDKEEKNFTAQSQPQLKFPDNFQLLKLVNFPIDRNKRIGRGHFGYVYKGVLRGTDVAVKELEIPKKRKAEMTESLINEIKVSAAIRHPSIVQFMGYCIDTEINCCLLLVYELVDGHNLDDILFEPQLKDEYKFTLGKRYVVLLEVSQALAYLHNRKPHIVHGDIKPVNVMVSKNGHAKICDLGLSKFKEDITGTLASTFAACGTPIYMAPEQLLHKKTSSVKSDVYAFGALTYEVVFEEYLWDITNLDDRQLLLDKVQKEQIPHKLQQRVKHSAYDVIIKCVQYDYHRRPGAQEIVDDLSKLCSSFNSTK